MGLSPDEVIEFFLSFVLSEKKEELELKYRKMYWLMGPVCI
jgi:hypothetical protein